MATSSSQSEGTLSSTSSAGEERTSCRNRIYQWNPPLWLEKIVVGLFTPILIWVVIFLLLGNEGLPGGQIFALLVIIFIGIGAGYVVELIKLPPLLGMLLVGIAIGNLPGLEFGKDLSGDVSSVLRQIALVVILIRAGLGLDPVALAKLSAIVIRLTCGPCLMEALALGIASHFILGFPWAWGFLLGFVLAAVSPAVIVPCLLSLRDRNFGVAKGIPTLVIAAASFDDIVAISGFGVTLGFAIAQKESLTMTILRGPIELVLGISFGILWGLALGIFLCRSEKESKESTVLRFVFTFAGGCFSVFGSQYIKFPGSGALGCLTSAFVAAIIWRKKGVLGDNDNLNWAFQNLWFIFQPLLFGLIGCEIDLHHLDSNVVLWGLLCLSIGLTVRVITSFFMVARAGLTFKERVFIAIAWLPKATVQAAIGPVAYDLARQSGAGKEAETMGLEVLTIAVISILLTAPVGAAAIMLFGPVLLSADKGPMEQGSDNAYADGDGGELELKIGNGEVNSGKESPNEVNEAGEGATPNTPIRLGATVVVVHHY